MSAALADDLIITPEIGIRFHYDVTVKNYKSSKWDGAVAMGTVITGDEIEYYDVSDDIVVATPTLKSDRYGYLNYHVHRE